MSTSHDAQGARREFFVDPEGDIELKLPDDVFIVVNYYVMKNSGQYFNSMLKRVWDTHQGERSPSQRWTYEVQAEDSSAMVDLCRLLHNNTAELSPLLDVKRDNVNDCSRYLVRLAVPIDQRFCAPVLNLQSEAILSRFARKSILSNSSIHELRDQASAAYLLNNNRMFALFTRRMAIHGTGHELAHTIFFHDAIANSEVLLDALLVQRTSCQMIISDAITDWRRPSC